VLCAQQRREIGAVVAGAHSAGPFTLAHPAGPGEPRRRRARAPTLGGELRCVPSPRVGSP
jgi:hypothetical protein